MQQLTYVIIIKNNLQEKHSGVTFRGKRKQVTIFSL